MIFPLNSFAKGLYILEISLLSDFNVEVRSFTAPYEPLLALVPNHIRKACIGSSKALITVKLHESMYVECM